MSVIFQCLHYISVEKCFVCLGPTHHSRICICPSLCAASEVNAWIKGISKSFILHVVGLKTDLYILFLLKSFVCSSISIQNNMEYQVTLVIFH